MASPCDTPPKNRFPASINSFDENGDVIGGCGGKVTSEGGGCDGVVPVVWAMTDVDATATITPVMAATRKLKIIAGSLAKPQQF
jgi:hypothetical protein